MIICQKHTGMTEKLSVVALILLTMLILSSCTLTQGGTDGAGSVGEARGFTIYFIDVGQADSALVLCDGRSMLIDGGNVADSDLIYAFLKKHGVKRLDYIVATHGHEDHCGGLAGALNYAEAGIALSPVTKFDSVAFGNFVKYLDEQGVSITVPEPGHAFALGNASVELIGPITESAEPNNTSIVLRVVYGETSFLFTGDAERAEEADILDASFDLQSTVLKVGHHGGDTSTTYPFLREVMPKYAIISVGANNSYGHPHENTLSRLRDAGAAVYRTDLQGTITCVSDGKTVSFQTEKNSATPTDPTAAASEQKNPITTEETTEQSTAPSQSALSGEYATSAAAEESQSRPPVPDEAAYIGNVNTHKFHLPSCRSLPGEKNRIFFAARDSAVEAGYSPCGICKP
jgi:competence protein ComEC